MTHTAPGTADAAPVTSGTDTRSLWRMAVVAFLVLRIVVTLVSALAVNHGTDVEDIDPVARDMLGEPSLDQGVAGDLLGPFQRQDALRYLRIARDGYANEHDSVFAPLYPTLIRVVSFPLGDDGQARVIAALLISNVAAVVAFYLLLRLVQAHFGPHIARRSLITLLLFPTSFFLIAAYTESLFLCFTLASLLRLSEQRRVEAGIFGALAALTRTTGWVLAIPLLWDAWQSRRNRSEGTAPAQVADLVAAALPLAAAVGFLTYRSAIGLPSISDVYEEYWLTSMAWPGKALLRSLGWIATGSVPADYGTYFYLDVVAMCLAVAVCVWGWSRMPRTWWLYSAAATFFVLLPDSVERTVNSTSRYVLVIFPVFVMLAHIRSFVVRVLGAALAVLLGVASMWAMATWFWVA